MAKARKAGQPTKFRPEHCPQLIEHFKKGLSYESFAAIADVDVDTLYNWEKLFPEFSEAKKRGVAHSRLMWEQVGLEGLWDQTEYENGKISFQKKLNSTVWIFNMKNRFGWRDAVDVRANVSIDGLVFDPDYEPSESSE